MILYISSKFSNKPDTARLIEAAHHIGIRTKVILQSFDVKNERVMYNGEQEHGAVYGEAAFAEFLAQEMRWNLYSNSLDWITKIPTEFIKRSIVYGSLEDIINIEHLNQSILHKKILEPADDISSFLTGKYDKFPRVPLSINVLAHADVDWQVKYRVLIVNSKIEDLCCYRVAHLDRASHPVIHDTTFLGNKITAGQFVQQVLEKTTVAPACILDVGFIANTGWSVIGTYPVWSSDYYACNITKFLKSLFIACENR